MFGANGSVQGVHKIVMGVRCRSLCRGGSRYDERSVSDVTMLLAASDREAHCTPDGFQHDAPSHTDKHEHMQQYTAILSSTRRAIRLMLLTSRLNSFIKHDIIAGHCRETQIDTELETRRVTESARRADDLVR